MFRNFIITAAITFAALVPTTNVRADFGLYTKNPRTGQYQMTMTHKDRGYLDGVAASLRKSDQQVVVQERVVATSIAQSPKSFAAPVRPVRPTQPPAALRVPAATPIVPATPRPAVVIPGTAVPNEFAIYYFSPTLAHYVMTMISRDRAYLDGVAASLQKSGQKVVVQQRMVPPLPGTPTRISPPAGPVSPPPQFVAPIHVKPVPPPPVHRDFTPKPTQTFVLQTRSPGGQLRTIGESQNRSQLEQLALSARKSGFEAQIVTKINTPLTVPKDDPMPAKIQLAGVWQVLDAVGSNVGDAKSYSIEIYSVQGNIFYYKYNYVTYQGTFDPVKKTITINPRGTQIKAEIHLRGGVWTMYGTNDLPITNISAFDRLGSWRATRQTTATDLIR